VEIEAAAVDESLDVFGTARVPRLLLGDEGRIERIEAEAEADALPQIGIRQRNVVDVLECVRKRGLRDFGRRGG
jgi:hypothetical protein